MNVELYREVVGLVAGRLGPAYQLDSAWADGLEKQAAAQKERLESDLQSSRTSLAKESIRLGYQDLGEFYYARGDLDNALKNFVRTRDYCSMTRHSVDMCLNVIKVAVGLESFSHVNTYVTKAEHTPDLNDPKARHKLKAAAGLVQLSQQHYTNAARKFLECGVAGLTKDKPNDNAPAPFAQVLAAEDVAVYGGLCALASLDRTELRRRVVDNMAFRGLLDLVPWMRELIYDFCGSKYGGCLRVLGAMKGELMLDLHLARHVSVLYQQIRERCFLQYFSPYLSVDLARMSEAFGAPVGEMEKEVAQLIRSNRLPARVDSQKKTLHRRQVDPREEGYKKVFGMGKDFLREVRAMLLRTSLVEHGVCVDGGGVGGREGGRRGFLAGGRLSQSHSMGITGGFVGGRGRGGGMEGRMEGESSAEEEEGEEEEEEEEMMEGGDEHHGWGGGVVGANIQDPDMYVGNN